MPASSSFRRCIVFSRSGVNAVFLLFLSQSHYAQNPPTPHSLPNTAFFGYGTPYRKRTHGAAILYQTVHERVFFLRSKSNFFFTQSLYQQHAKPSPPFRHTHTTQGGRARTTPPPYTPFPPFPSFLPPFPPSPSLPPIWRSTFARR